MILLERQFTLTSVIDFTKIFDVIYDPKNVIIKLRNYRVPIAIKLKAVNRLEAGLDYGALFDHVLFIKNVAIRNGWLSTPIVGHRNKLQNKVALFYVVIKYCNPTVNQMVDMLNGFSKPTIQRYKVYILSGREPYKSACNNFEKLYLDEVLAELKRSQHDSK